MTDSSATSGSARSARAVWSRLWIPAALLVLGLAPVLVLAGVAIRESSDAARDQAERGLAASADATAVALHEQLVGLADLVESYANRRSIRDAMAGPADVALLGNALEEIRTVNPDIALAFVTDAAGVLETILPASPSIVGESFSHRDWYRGAIERDQGYVSEVYRTAATGSALVVVAAAPIRGPNGVVGVFVAGLDLASVQRFVDGFADAQDVELTITDQRGVLVATPDDVPDAIVSVVDDERVASGLAGGRGVGQTAGDGSERVVYAYSPVEGPGWVVVAELPEDVAFAGVGDVNAGIVAASIVIAAVAAVGALVLLLLQERRRSAEQRLARSEAFLDSIIENIPSLVAVKDHDERFVQVNRAGERFLDRPRDELVGRTAHELFDPVEAEQFSSCDRQVLATGEPVETPSTTITTSGRGRRLFNIKRLPILAPVGGERYVLVLAEDITDRLAAEELLRSARQDAERANEAKTEFISQMSHELRTPLNAVLGFGQLLEAGDLSEDQRDSVRQILQAGRHLLALMNEVLDTSLIDAGKLRVSVEAVRLCDVVDESLDLVRPMATGRGISIPASGDIPPDLWVRCDYQRLKQVLVNLLSNAVKYNRDGGSVSVRSVPTGDVVQIEVADTGPGIPADKMPLLFAPFERLGAERSTVEGTGLGLALSRSLVEQMGGALDATSTLGEGSTFVIELAMLDAPGDPASAPDGRDQASDDHTATGGPARRVLYVEDNPANVLLVEQIVAAEPRLDLVVARSGTEGLAAAEQRRPDVVVLDLNLPDLPGQTVLLKLREQEQTRDVPVVVVSADAAALRRERLLDAGATDYITKPFDIDVFRTAILRYADGAGPMSVPERWPAADEGQLDRRVVGQLLEVLTDPRSRSDFIATLRTNFESRLAELDGAVEAGDEPAIGRHAHSLKGIAATAGLIEVAAISAAIERDAGAGAQRLRALASGLHECFSVGLVRLEELFASNDT